ncbi:MAG: hypothetical protein GX070_01895 [Alcaligenaceae bacterium]|nr:hypothetical protein [Alcaligenaceae bacterium]
MRPAQRFQKLSVESSETPPIVKLLVLRLLVLLNGHRKFIESDFFSDDTLAKFLKLDDWLGINEGYFDAKAIRTNLHRYIRKQNTRLTTNLCLNA